MAANSTNMAASIERYDGREPWCVHGRDGAYHVSDRGAHGRRARADKDDLRGGLIIGADHEDKGEERARTHAQ